MTFLILMATGFEETRVLSCVPVKMGQVILPVLFVLVTLLDRCCGTSPATLNSMRQGNAAVLLPEGSQRSPGFPITLNGVFPQVRREPWLQTLQLSLRFPNDNIELLSQVGRDTWLRSGPAPNPIFDSTEEQHGPMNTWGYPPLDFGALPTNSAQGPVNRVLNHDNVGQSVTLGASANIEQTLRSIEAHLMEDEDYFIPAASSLHLLQEQMAQVVASSTKRQLEASCSDNSEQSDEHNSGFKKPHIMSAPSMDILVTPAPASRGQVYSLRDSGIDPENQEAIGIENDNQSARNQATRSKKIRNISHNTPPTPTRMTKGGSMADFPKVSPIAAPIENALLHSKAEFHPTSSRVVEDLTNTQVECDVSHKTEDLYSSSQHRFRISEKNVKVFAWIGSLVSNVGENHSGLSEIFINTCFTAVGRERPSNIAIESSFDKLGGTQYKIMKEFWSDLFSIIWCLNGYLLDAFGTRSKEPLYFEEQQRLMIWLILTIETSQRKSRSATSMDPSHTESEFGPIDQLRELVPNLLHYKDEKTVWRIKRFLNSKRPQEFRIRWITLTEAAINLMGSYYKNTNYEKWNFIFPDDQHFLKAFQRIKRFVYYLHYQTSLKRKRRGSPLLPWSDGKCRVKPRILNGNTSKNSIQKSINKHVEEVQEECDTLENQLNFPHSGNFEKRVYGWLASFPTIKDTEASMSKNSLHIWSKVKVPTEDQKEFDSIIELMCRIGRKAWLLNHRFLQSIGSHSESQAFKDEQDQLQRWLSSEPLRFSMRLNSHGTIGDINEIGDPQFITLGDKLSTFGKIKETLELWKVPYRPSERDKFVLEEQMIMETKSALQIIGEYYKKKNYNKWRLFLIHDERFLNLLIEARNKLRAHHFSSEVEKRIKILQGFSVLPWKDESFVDSKRTQEALYKVFGSAYSKRAIDMVPCDENFIISELKKCSE